MEVAEGRAGVSQCRSASVDCRSAPRGRFQIEVGHGWTRSAASSASRQPEDVPSRQDMRGTGMVERAAFRHMLVETVSLRDDDPGTADGGNQMAERVSGRGADDVGGGGMRVDAVRAPVEA